MYACVAMLLASCTGDDVATGGAPITRTDGDAVSFSTEMSSMATTRATTGMVSDIDGLKNVPEGFGVFAYLTDANDFKTQFPTDPASDSPSKDISSYSSFSDFFMQNQQVRWGVQYVENGDDADLTNDVNHYDWVYSPLKYWPNYTNNEDSSDGHETPGPRYISFFAYAPWADASETPTEGVINYVRSDDRTPHVIYKIGTADKQVDLLWANAIDAKRNGNGLISVGRNKKDTADSLIYQRVPLEFKHALSAIDIYVQRVYDEPAFTGKIPDAVLYPTIYISKLELTSAAPSPAAVNPLQTSGKLSLIDGTWSDYTDTWTTPGSSTQAWTNEAVTITYDESMINDTIRGTTSTEDEFIRDIELDKWKWILDTHNTTSTDDDEWIDATEISEEVLKKEPTRYKSAYGLSEDERHFFRNSFTQVFIPSKVTLVPTLTYTMVVRDDNLQLNYLTDSDDHRYNRLVNIVEGNSVTLDLVAGKRYSLLIRVGVEHVTFELLRITDWDFPMRFDPNVVSDFTPETNGKVVNED